MGGKLKQASVLDYQRLAQERLDPAIWHYLSDGDSAPNVKPRAIFAA